MSPYFGKTFFQFFPVFFGRLVQLFSGALSWKDLASDEIQIFVLICISVAAALIGTLLVLKRMTMLANSLSHTILLGIVIAYMLLGKAGITFPVLIIAALIAGLLTSLLTQFLHQVIKLQEDASIGLVFTSLFALGILLVTLYTRNAHIGLEIVMGNADALHFNDLKIASGVALFNSFFLLIFFKEWKLICFDSCLASSLGYRPSFYNYLLMFLASLTAISAFRAVGVLLFLAFLVGLPVTARFLTSNLSKLLWIACGIGTFCSLLSVALARHFLTVYSLPFSTSGLVVTLIGIFFTIIITLHSLTFTKKRV